MAAARDYPVLSGGLKGHLLRLVVLALLVACAATFWSPAARADNRSQRKSQPTLKPLWSAFPLDRNQEPKRGQAVAEKSARAAQPSSTDNHTSGTLPLIGAAVLAILIAGGVALVVVRRPQPALLLAAGRHLPMAVYRLPFRPPEGGFLMANARRRLWPRNESGAPTEEPEGDPQRVVDRLAEYASGGNRSSPPAADQEAHDAPVAESEATPADLSAVGDEVGAVLKTAQEAAETIRRAALEEAAKRRDEAEAAAAAEIAEAQRVRAEADTYASQTTAAADGYAEQRRSETERESARIVADAESRLAAADAEVDRKLREAEVRERARIDMLKAEAEVYEERLDNVLVLFREMSSQLEELLGPRRKPGGDRAAPDEALDEALHPHSSDSRSA